MTLFKNKMYILAVLVSSVVSLAAADFQTVLEPSTVMEGEPFTLQLTSRGSVRAELQELPKNFTYRGSSQSTRIINGDRTNMVGYQFIAPAPGKYKIPPLKVKLGKASAVTPELNLQVVKDTAAQQSSEDVFVRAVTGLERRKVYVGEDIPLLVNLYYPQKVRLQTGYPVLDVGKSLFRDFRKVNPENPAFGIVRRNRKVLDEKLYEEISFPTAFRPLAAGMLTIRGAVPCYILLPDNRRRDPFDDFFGGSSNYRRVEKMLKISPIELEVLPLPPPPADGVFLGLVGQYTIECRLDRQEVNALEPVSLNIKIAGSGSLETLKIPELVLPDCRVYPGEVRYTQEGAVVSYAIIPLKAGMLNFKNNFCYFDPETGKYMIVKFDAVLPVKPSVVKSSVPAAPSAAPEAAPAAVADDVSNNNPPVRTTLLYCKKAPESAFMQFFRRNRIALIWMLFIAGPLVWLAGDLIRKKFSGRRDDAASRRREKASAMRNILADKVRRAPAQELLEIASGEVAHYLADRWQLPPGVTLDDLADAAEDAELASALRECSQAGYLPEEMAQSAIREPEKLRKVLLNALKCIVLVFALGAFTLAADSPEPVRDWQAALQAYDRGDYNAGRKFFEQYAENNPDDPNVLYNLGCFAEAAGDQEAALHLMECAGLIAPLDSAIHENRNVMRRKFFWPEVGRANTPVELARSLRDRFHPETYILIASAVWFLFFVLMIFRNKLSGNLRSGIIIIAVVVFVLSLIMAVAQYSSTYSNDQALVVAKNADLYTFPGVHNGKKVGTLPGGTPVKVVETQSAYSLISSRDLEGWTPNKNIRKLLNR